MTMSDCASYELRKSNFKILKSLEDLKFWLMREINKHNKTSNKWRIFFVAL